MPDFVEISLQLVQRVSSRRFLLKIKYYRISALILLLYMLRIRINQIQREYKIIHVKLDIGVMFRFLSILIVLFITAYLSSLCAQVIIRGKVLDAVTGESLPGANVVEQGTSNGAVTSFEGEFQLHTTRALPTTLEISYVGYLSQRIDIVNDRHVTILMQEGRVLEGVEIVEDRILQREKESPLTRISFHEQQIMLNPSTDISSGLGMQKDIDVVSGSMAFKIVNTRGFNSTSPVRMLQIIDGVDNQSPGLNFSLGNFLGSSELDLLRVEVIVGASGPFYGPNAFNGVISMQTKDPFIHQGLSAMTRVGERNMKEMALRYAEAIKNKKGNEWMAFKLNIYGFSAQDWKAENYDPITDSRVPYNNPGGYDAVNIYGDEYNLEMDLTTDAGHLYNQPGLGNFYRTGYKETDLADYDTRNFKGNAALHFRLNPAAELLSSELLLSSSLGAGTTMYQGDNRFSLRNILFAQHKIEWRKREHFFLRAYYTHENSGDSYDPYFTALRLVEMGKSTDDWTRDYKAEWRKTYYPKMVDNGYPVFDFGPPPSFDFEGAAAWLVQYNDSMQLWHNQNAGYANQAHPGNEAGTLGYLTPGSGEFQEAFAHITTRLNNESNGTRFYDRSSLLHVHGEHQFQTPFFQQVTAGANFRMYAPDSKGTIFHDTAGTNIRNYEFGAYIGLRKSFFDHKPLQVSATIRVDKNQNFSWIGTYAAGIVWHANQNTYLRMSLSSALRNPTLTDQYLYLNVGPAILAGHISSVDSLITPESFREATGHLDLSRLVYFNLDPLKPEFVNTIEAGIRTTLFDRLYVDAGGYLNAYKDFLGYVIGIKSSFLDDPNYPFPYNMTVFRYTTNSKNKVTTGGWSIGLEYDLTQYFTIQGNYSYNALRKSAANDPVIPAYNTPEHKYNIGIRMQDYKAIRIGTFDRSGFAINYKWVDGFQYEGSPQFTGMVPAYGIVDAQVHMQSTQHHLTVKLGASNLFNYRHFEAYGGPLIGRLGYVQVVYQL